MKAVLTLITLALALNAQAGRYFVTGHDADFHAARSSSEAANIIWKSIRYVTGGKALVVNSSPKILLVTGNVDPGGDPLHETADPRLGLLAAGYEPLPNGRTGPNDLPERDQNVPLRGYFEVAYSDDQTPSNYKLDTVIVGGLSAFDAIVVASDFGGWLRQSELDVLNARALYLQAFVNDNPNKGIVAFAQSGARVGGISRGTSSARFAFLPGIESEVLEQHEGGVVPLNCNPVGLTQNDVSVNVAHCVFTCVPDWHIVDIDTAGNILSIIRDTTASQAAGMVDSDFSAKVNSLNNNLGLDGPVSVIALEPGSGKILVGGNFTMPRKHIMRLFRDGTLDTSFNPPPITAVAPYLPDVKSIVFEENGNFPGNHKILVGGFLPRIAQGSGYHGGKHLIRLGKDGALDTTFVFNGNYTEYSGYINAIALQGDNKIIIGGSWTPSSTVPAQYLARLTTSGAFDTTWQSGANNVVHSILIEEFPSGNEFKSEVLIGGEFTSVTDSVGTHSASRIARILNGSFDGTFASPRNGTVRSLLLPKGFFRTYVVGGSFTTAPSRFARLFEDGAPDDRFVPPAGLSSISVIKEQCDGKLVVAGAVPQRIARFRSDGIQDTSFNAQVPNNPVYAIAIQDDGKILIGGVFTSIAGQPGQPAQPAFRFARLHGSCN